MSVKSKSISFITLTLLFSSASYAAPKMDANGDNKITQEEYAAHFDLEFNKKDKNFDGRLTAKERRDWSQEQTRKAMREAFKKIDPNKDGKLTEDEYAENVFSEMEDQISMNGSYLDKTFDEMDEDHNDHVSRLEYKNYIDRSMKTSMEIMADSMREQFRMLDKDKDGLVTETEYTGQLDIYDNLSSANISGDNERNSLMPKPVALDGNNDGVITRTEQRKHANYSFQQRDSNNDGVITKSESAILFTDLESIGDNMGVYLESQIITR